MLEMEAIARRGRDVTLDETAVQELQDSLRGRLIRPGDETYEEARIVHNAMIDK